MSLHKLTLTAPTKIQQIKALRGLTGWGLKESKTWVDQRWKGEGVEISGLVDLPFSNFQRDLINEGCRVKGYDGRLDGVATTIRDTGYYRLHWKELTNREPWTIEVFHTGRDYQYREGRDQRYLHSLSELMDGGDPDWNPIAVEEITYDEFRVTNND